MIPTFNRAEALAALLGGLRRYVEDGVADVIVVNDGSSDRTSEVLDAAPWVKGITQANRGAAAARNTGARAARTEILAFLDDDCMPGRGWPGELLPPFEDPRVGGVGGKIVGQGGGVMGAFMAIERQVDHGRDLRDGVDYLVTANAAYRATVFRSLGGFDERFPGAAGEDVDFSWRVRALGLRLMTIDGAEVAHRHRTSIAEILRTYHRHGRARAILRSVHPSDRLPGAALRAVGVGTLSRRWHAYRSVGVSRTAATGLSALRAAGLLCYAAGFVGEARHQRAFRR